MLLPKFGCQILAVKVLCKIAIDFRYKNFYLLLCLHVTSILQSIFYKNSPLHDGATIIRDNFIVATRVILPISDNTQIPSRFGLRHRAAIGVTEKTDAICLLVSEETGEISYIKDGNFVLYSDLAELSKKVQEDVIA